MSFEYPKHGLVGLQFGKQRFTRTEYDEQAYDVCILFKHGCKKFLLKTGLEVGTDVLLTFKTNVGDDLYMIVCLHDL